MNFHLVVNSIFFVFLLIKPSFNRNGIERENLSPSNNYTTVDNAEGNLLHSSNKYKHPNNNSLNTTHYNTKNYGNYLQEGFKHLHSSETGYTKQTNKSIEDKKLKFSKRQKKSSLKPRTSTNKRNSSSRKKVKKRGKVYQDTREDILHYKLVDDMMFKPLNSNNTVSIVFSDESEITQADVDQAIAGKDGSCIAIPLKRKKDVYREFVRWVHLQEKNERRAKIEKDVMQKYKNMQGLINGTEKGLSNMSKEGVGVSVHKNESKKTFSVNYNISNKSRIYVQFNQSTHTDFTKSTSKMKNSSHHHPGHLDNSKPKGKYESKHFKEISVELNDPKFLDTLQKKVIKHTAPKKKGKKKRKQKERQTFQGNPTDLSPEDYSAQEAFILNSQKEAMGRRFYQLFANKTASDFWDNNTLETTKMLEFLIPLGEHLHKTLDQVPPNQGQHFMTDLQMYKTELEKFIVLVKNDKAETRNDVVALIEEPYDHVCETKYCEDEIKLLFYWNDEEYKQFEKLLEETREMWFDLQLFHHCYQFVSESAESYMDYNCTKEERLEIIKNNTWTLPKSGPKTKQKKGKKTDITIRPGKHKNFEKPIYNQTKLKN